MNLRPGWIRQALLWMLTVRRLEKVAATVFIVRHPMQFRRATVWIVAHRGLSVEATRVPTNLPSQWGDLAGLEAEPVQPGAVALLRRVAPPLVSSTAPTVDWDAVHARIGIELPKDYRELIDDRGTGVVAGIVVRGPAGHAVKLDLEQWLVGFARTVANLRQQTCDHYPPPFYPEYGGILPWGEDEGGSVVAWVPSSPNPDRWPIGVLSPEWDDLALYPLTATGYLLSRLPGARQLATAG
jgi:hypothetical protein